MPLADFIHLKVRSAYSLTEGANKVDKIVSLAKDAEMPAVAVTDRNNLFGALEFSQYAAKGGVQPIVGCDLGIRREEEGGVATASKVLAIDWLTLLVQSEQGYLNLMRLVSRAHLEFKTGSVAALPLADLEGSTEGLIALTGSAGSSVGRLLAAGQTPAAAHLLDRLQSLFEGRLYVELQRHGEDVERRIEGPLVDLAYERNLPRRSQPPPPDVGALFQVGGRDAQPVLGHSRGLRQYPCDRPALRLHADAAQAHPAALHQARRP